MSGNRFLEKAPLRLIDQLRAFFHPKDRSVILADETFVEGENMTPGNPVTGRGRLFWRDKCWRQLDEDGTETALCNPTAPAWVDWTPTVDQGGSVTISIDSARVFYDNGHVTLLCDITVTGSGSAGSSIRVENLPYPIAHTTGRVCNGEFIIVDAGSATYVGAVDNAGSDRLAFRIDQAGFMGINPNFALANNDTISFVAIYEDGT